MKLYAVVRPDGAVVLSSLAKTPEQALRRMSHWVRNRWAESRRRGYTIRQVRFSDKALPAAPRATEE
jgi:hypothetical protein